MNTQPGFSVVICNYNYAHFVCEAIDSALAQDYPADRFVVIVVDDGSTDHSRTTLERYREHPQVRVLHQENRGQTAAFVAGVSSARHELISLLDSDDLFMPSKFSRIAQWMQRERADAKGLFVCHDLEVWDDVAGNALQHGWFDVTDVPKRSDSFDIDGPALHFPFSVPAGLTLCRQLTLDCLNAIPAWAFPRGTDGVLCPLALLATGRVRYLHERLGRYRVHSSNEFASIRNGRYLPRFDLTDRVLSKMTLIDRWLEIAPLDAVQQARARGYFRRWEALARLTLPERAITPTRVSLALVGSADAARTLDTMLEQRHPHCELVLPADVPAPAHARAQLAIRHSSSRSDAPGLEQLIAAAQVASGECIVFVEAGDQLDRDHVERRLLHRQHGPLVGVTCCDVRLVSREGEVLNQSVFATSGAWPNLVQQVPPLAVSLAQWIAPPVSACMFPRDVFEELARCAPSFWPDDLNRAAIWLPLQLALHTRGLLRFRETLCSVHLQDGLQASYGWLSAPHSLGGSLTDVPLAEGARWFANWYSAEQERLATRLPPAWHQRFESWLAAQVSALQIPPQRSTNARSIT